MHQFAEGYAYAALTACAILIFYAWAKSREGRPDSDRDPGL
jgi:hypothetical protein